MAMNIKNGETERLARKLARVTGESVTGAITEAVRERLERKQSQAGEGLAERLLRIGRDCAARLKEPYRSADPDELFYDENGLPR